MQWTKLLAFMPKYWHDYTKTDYNIASTEKNFRVGTNNNLPPYIKIPIDTKVIQEITISPTCNYELAKNGHEDFLVFKHIEIPKEKIVESDIPYRKV